MKAKKVRHLRNLKTEKEYWEQYDIEKYPRPSVSADVVAFSVQELPTDNYRKPTEATMSVLLIRRGAHPFKGAWALPGGFFRPGETIEACAARELREETGLVGQKLMPLGMFSRPGRDPRGWIVSNAYLAIVAKTKSAVRGGDDAAEARWVAVDDVVTGKVKLAFDHREIVDSAIARLRPEDRDAIGFAFLPPEFTLAELQYVHEFMEGHELVSPNFRRKMMPSLMPLDRPSESVVGHRPAALYAKKG